MFDVVLKGPHNERERVWAAAVSSAGVECLSLFHVTAKANERDTHLLSLDGRDPRTVFVGWLGRHLPGHRVIAA